MNLKNPFAPRVFQAIPVRALTFGIALSLAATAGAQATLPPPPAPYTPNATVVEDVVARVNDQIITRTDISRTQAQLDQELKSQNTPPAEIAARDKDLLRDQIDQQLLLSKGKDLDINCDTELIKQLDDIRKQNHLDTMEDLERAAQQQGVSYEDFKASLKNSCITQHVVQQEVGSKLAPMESDVLKYYNAHKAELNQPESIHLSEILIPTPADASAETIAAAQAKANNVVTRLKAGDKFGDLAKLYSTGPNPSAGGELGIYKRGMLAPEFEKATFDLPAGGYTQPIQTRQGFVIFGVTEHTKAGIPPYADVKQQMEYAVYEQKMKPALRAYLTQLRTEAAIQIAPGFVDTGSPDNDAGNMIVNSAYVPPAQKVKKAPILRKGFERTTVATNKTKGHVVNATATTSGKTTKSGKPKKIHREKVRFGQAPRENLPAATTGGNLAEDRPAEVGNNVTPLTPDQVAPGRLAPPIAPVTATPAPVDQNADPLAPKAVVKKKTRYADRALLPKQPKVTGPDPESIPSKPTEAEIEAGKINAAPLGLSGDTAKKAPKHKRAKGEKKKRLEDQPKTVKPATDNAPVTAPVQPVKP
jgi:peptidyl-prolyl cis-trans isomerase SurA